MLIASGIYAPSENRVLDAARTHGLALDDLDVDALALQRDRRGVAGAEARGQLGARRLVVVGQAVRDAAVEVFHAVSGRGVHDAGAVFGSGVVGQVHG